MKKVLLLYGLLIVVIAIFFFFTRGNLLNFNFGGGNNDVSSATAKVGGKTYKLILAKTDEEKVTGLSGRDNLADDQGMLFIFQEKGDYGFWMKNMKFPIDIIYIDENKVVTIVENAPAPTENQDPSSLPIYKPGAPVNYVLELSAGQSKEAGVKEGDTIEFNGL